MADPEAQASLIRSTLNSCGEVLDPGHVAPTRFPRGTPTTSYFTGRRPGRRAHRHGEPAHFEVVADWVREHLRWSRGYLRRTRDIRRGRRCAGAGRAHLNRYHPTGAIVAEALAIVVAMAMIIAMKMIVSL
jgi:hypothetical protein